MNAFCLCQQPECEKTLNVPFHEDDREAVLSSLHTIEYENTHIRHGSKSHIFQDALFSTNIPQSASSIEHKKRSPLKNRIEPN